jgi:hypothetical protein
MKFLWNSVTRLFHPITLAVILVGIAGFLLGLIVAVERQDAAVVAPQESVADPSRVARLETALAGRDSEVSELQAELAKQRAEAPSPEVMAEAAERITGLEAALADRSAELTALQSELTELSGQLAEAIQSRDDLRKEGEQAALDRDGLRRELEQATQFLDAQRAEREQAKRDSDTEREGQDRTIADLRRELEAARERASAPAPEKSPVAEAPAEAPQPAVAKTESAAADSEATPPAAAPPAEPKGPEQQAAAAPAPKRLGPIAQGIAAYRAADYAKAYSLWLPPALKGSSRAQFYVGALYFEGRGVPKDLVLSYMWLRAATKADDPGAIKLLDRVREGMSGPELAEAETRIANGETIPPR